MKCLSFEIFICIFNFPGLFDIDIFLSDNEIRSLKVQLDHASRQLRDMNKNASKTTENAELFSTIKVMDSIKLQGITCFSLWIFSSLVCMFQDCKMLIEKIYGLSILPVLS